MRSIKPAAIVLALCLLPATIAEAQFDKDFKSWYGHLEAGYSVPQSGFSDAVDGGWLFGGGATYKPSSWPVGIITDLSYSRYELKSSVTDAVMASGGDVDVWSATGGAVWAPTTGGKVGFYISGAIGAYRLEARLTEPGIGCGWVCDPFLPWYCYPSCGGGQVVTDSEATTELGGNFAVGLTFDITSLGSTLFLEAKYNYVDTDRTETPYVPICIGYRW